jgi:hypothetical protein
VNVPARLVNGFKAVEWNPMTNQYVIRQSNAHSWVEAYLRPEGWRTFDPSVQREAATPRPVIVKRWWRTAYDTAETLWVQHVLNYDPEAQSELYNKFAQGVLFLQKLWLTAVMLAGMEPLGMSKWQLQSLLNQFTEPVRIALLAAAIFIAIMAASYLALGVSRWLRGRRRVSGAVRYYDRMERQLAKRGIFRKAWQTPWEFHDAVAGKGWPEMPAVRTITSAFCRARYGGHEPSSEELLEIDSALRQIRAAKYSAAGRN